MSEQKLEFVATLDSTQLVAGTNTASSSLQKVGDTAEKSGQKINTLSKGAIITAGASFVGLASNISSTIFAYNDLADMQIRVKSTALAVSKAQEAVNKLQAEGKTNTLDYKQAIEKLEVATLRNKDSIEEADKANIQFGLNLLTMATSTVPAFVSVLVGLKGAQLAGAGATAVASGANIGFTASIVGATAGIWANTVAMLSNPIFAIATAGAIAVAVGLIATNTWGLRDSIFGATEAVKESTEAVKENKDVMKQLSSTFVGVPPVIDATTFSLNGMNLVTEKTTKNLKEVNTEIDILKKNDNFALLIKNLQDSQGLASARELIELATQRYQDGDIRGAIAVEKSLQSIGRSTPSLSGHIRTISEQMLSFGNKSSTFRNIGGGVGSLFGSSLSASALSGLQSKTGTLGILNLPSLQSVKFTNAGSLSARLSSGSSGKSVADGGSRSSGRSSKHGGANRATEFQRTNAVNSITGGDDNLQFLRSVTGMDIDFPRWSPRYRGDSYMSWNDSFNEFSKQVSEANQRVSLGNELLSLGQFDSDVISSGNLFSLSSDTLRSMLESERNEISTSSQKLGLSQSQVITSRNSLLTQNDITNMLAFRERESLAMVSM
jgi:hypothetical protein